ncbi:MAG: hypothetical protein Q9223_002511 [Gallowayella weberi]
MFTSLSTELYQFILAQGFMFGIGATMLFYPAISAISHWFDQRRGLALGIVVASSSIGGICWPLMLERLFVQVGFAWTVRTAGFMCLALLAPSCLLIKPRLPPRKSADVKAGDIKDSFADIRYVLLTAAMFFIFWGMFIPFYYLPSYGLAHGMSLYMANNLLATLNAGSFAGRIVSGILADRLGRNNLDVSSCHRDGRRYNRLFCPLRFLFRRIDLFAIGLCGADYTRIEYDRRQDWPFDGDLLAWVSLISLDAGNSKFD